MVFVNAADLLPIAGEDTLDLTGDDGADVL